MVPSQPSAKFRKELDAAATAVGAEAVRQHCCQWLELLTAMPVLDEAQVHEYRDGTAYHFTTYTYLQRPNQAVAKGLIWTVQPLADAAML